MTPQNIVYRMHYHHKLLNMRYVRICKVLCPIESFYEIKNRYKKITAQDRSIVDVGNLKIRSHYSALVSMMEKGFFDSSRKEEVKKIFKRMNEERNTTQKIKRSQKV